MEIITSAGVIGAEVHGIDIRKSMIARAVKNTFKDNGTLEPNKDKTPKEKAISVADGIAQPLSV